LVLLTPMDFTYPINLCFECNGCGLCCGDTEQKTRHILLLETEAQEISTQTCLAIEQFAEPIIGKEPYVYEMKKPNGGKCFFLKDNRCINYEHRPLICRFYPFELKPCSDGTHAFDFTVECPTIGKGKTWVRKDFEALFELARKRLS
jgi:Fe-S-cluster containining protein